MSLSDKRKELRSTAFKTIADCLKIVEKQDKEFIKDIMKISEEEDVYRALTREDFIKRFNKRIEEKAGKELI